ncbi:MAG TPA: hypothetical protein VM491_19750, partial [Burkholderiaceae bacterium]|nr:hypothetical protein [Burkholderiaceae bacterium]
SKLAALGWLRNLPRRLLRQPPRIEAATPTARAAMGYLHANCGHCHNGSGALAGLDLTLAQQVSNPNGSATATVESLLRSASAEQPSGATPKAIPARAALLARRIASSNPYTRMPPLGVTITDREGVAVIERWIREDLQR